MRKRNVQNLLRNLMQDREAGREDSAACPDSQMMPTTLGEPLVRRGDRLFVIDLTRIRIFRNLHTFVQLLADEVIEQCGFGVADVMVRRKVDPNLTPDFAAVGLDWIMVYARLDAAENLPFYHRHFGNCLQVVFRALQTEKWGGILFPEFFGLIRDGTKQPPPALLFPFHLKEKEGGEGGHYFLVEYSNPGRFLRITLEDAVSSRLQLKHIPHRVVDQNVASSFLPDVTRVAEQIHQGILRECMNNRIEYNENPDHQPDLFRHLRQEGLPHLQTLHFTWPTDDIRMILMEKRETPKASSEFSNVLAKEIQLLEDPLVLACLSRGNIVELISEPHHVYFDVSRFGACLNIGFDERRTVLNLKDYLVRMPVLSQAVEARRDAMRGVRLFLIHHATSEVIGLLDAFREAGCNTLTTFFVKYSGVVPETYLETLMSLSPDVFRFYGLQRLESQKKFTGTYAFSRRYSPLSGLEEIEKILFAGDCDFFGAMRLAAGHLFLQEILPARKRGEQVLLAEDGGYLAPILNRFCLENRTVGDVFDYFHVGTPSGEDRLPFKTWLDDVFLGGIEHTKNGYDYDSDVMREFGKLHFPVASIAVSDIKRGPEARECAVSILNAVENILHRLGMLLSRRKILILGSQGAIGGFLKEELRFRIRNGRLFGVDIAAGPGKTERDAVSEAPTIDDLGSDVLLDIDMVIGVIGRSVFLDRHMEAILLRGHQKTLLFASGSTKTVEFTDLENYLQSLRDQENPKIGGSPVRVSVTSFRDLQTGVPQGYQASVDFPDDPSKSKILYLLGELMPINFLYYGIPREVVDEVMAQLFTVSCGLAKRQRSADPLPAKLLAVDREIDADAVPHEKSDAPR